MFGLAEGTILGGFWLENVQVRCVYNSGSRRLQQEVEKTSDFLPGVTSAVVVRVGNGGWNFVVGCLKGEDKNFLVLTRTSLSCVKSATAVSARI